MLKYLGVIFFLACISVHADINSTLVFDPPNFHFEVLAGTGEATNVAKFRIVNNGDQIVRVKDIISDCGCLQVRKFEKNIGPGEVKCLEAEIKWTSPKDFEGLEMRTDRRIILQTETGDAYILPVTIKCVQILAQPRSVIFDQNSEQKMQFRVSVSSDSKFKLKDVLLGEDEQKIFQISSARSIGREIVVTVHRLRREPGSNYVKLIFQREADINTLIVPIVSIPHES